MEILLDINPNIEALLAILYKGKTKETFFRFKEIQAEVEMSGKKFFNAKLSVVCGPLKLCQCC